VKKEPNTPVAYHRTAGAVRFDAATQVPAKAHRGKRMIWCVTA